MDQKEKSAPWFYSDSSRVPPVPFQFLRTSNEILLDQIRFPVQCVAEIWSGSTEELVQKFGATEMEVEELEGNQIRTRRLFFHVRCTLGPELIFHLAHPGIQR